jgi:YHS domain-containing protein
MKALILTIPLCILAGCSQPNKEAEIQQTIQMPSETKHTYLEVDPTVLASLKDPVCGMSVKNKVTDTLTYNHKLYGFCGTGCKEAFLKEPLQYQSATETESKK